MASFPEIVGAVAAAALQTFGMRGMTEQPLYEVLETHAAVELRHYGPVLAAETVVEADAMDARNEGFRRLAAFIFGDNVARDSIAMTAPVVTAPSREIAMTAPVVQTPGQDGAWRVQFIMPSRFTRDNLPVPTDPRVRIVEAPARDYAVLSFKGSRSARAVERETDRLLAAVEAEGWRVAGEPVSWFYDPPWTPPFLRRNEVAVAVER